MATFLKTLTLSELCLMHFLSFDYSVTRRKSPNVYKSCPKLITLKNERF